MIFLGSGTENYSRWTKNDKHLSVFSFHPIPTSLYLSAFWLDSPLPLRYTDFSRSIALYCNLFSLILKSFRKTQKNNTNDDLFLPVSSRILKLPTFFKVFIKLCAQQLLVLFTSPFFSVVFICFRYLANIVRLANRFWCQTLKPKLLNEKQRAKKKNINLVNSLYAHPFFVYHHHAKLAHTTPLQLNPSASKRKEKKISNPS